MKKNKSKSRNHSASKKVRKELETKLAAAFGEVVLAYGKAKKADKLIGKFAKQLAKKVTISATEDSITPFIKEEKTAPVVSKTKPAKTAAIKTPKKELVAEKTEG